MESRKEMRWGMPTMVELPDLESNAQLCRSLDLDFVEINMNLPMYQPENLDAAKELSRKYGVGFTVHLDENFAPADFNMLIADAYLETLCRTIRAAKRIGAPVINMHMSRGVHFKLPDEIVYLYDRYRDRYMARMQVLRSVCEDETRNSDIRICIENTDGYMDFQKKVIDFLLESPVFSLTWDVGHSHTAHLDDVPFLLSHRDRIAHFHIHDALGKRCHLMLGDGEIPLKDHIGLADSLKARCVLETKTVSALKKSAIWLREKI